VDYLQTSFLDTTQSSPSNGTSTPVPCCESEPPKDGSPACTCTKETFGCLIHPRGRDEWIASMRDSLARIFQSPEMARESMASEADYIAKSSVALAWLNRDSSSWKIAQQLLAGDWEPYSQTWPRAGMMRDGRCWPLPTWVRPISAKDGGVSPLWQTPVADDKVDRKDGKWNSRGEPKLSAQVKIWPTPTVFGNYNRKGASQTSGDGLATAVKWATPLASDWKSHSPAKQATNSRPLREQIGQSDGGPLNPTWVEWLMGWPIEWTALQPSETDKSHSARRQPGKS
jgi:hypothetical protein